MKVFREGDALTSPKLRPGYMFAAGLMIMVCTSAHADAPVNERVLAGPCMNCHGPDGRSPGAIPSIAGMPREAMKAKLEAFKSDNVPAGTTIMNRLSRGYTDAQIDALARYFAQTKPTTGAGAKP